MSADEGGHGPRLIGRTKLTSHGVSSDPKCVKAEFEAAVAVENERIAGLSGPLVCRCAFCPDWIGYSIADQIAHMWWAHGIEPVSKEGKFDKKCPVCRRVFHTDVPSVRFCGRVCKDKAANARAGARAETKPRQTGKPCERCGAPVARKRNRFCSNRCSALAQHGK